jgi:hypothetical protein
MSALPELDELEQVMAALGSSARRERLALVSDGEHDYPIHALAIGSDDPSAPVFGLVGGVHGLERIGAQVVLSYLTVLARLLEWDALLRRSLRDMRLVFVPIVNPAGMALRRRSNARGVDLMRNAPAHPLGRGSFLVGGQSLSSRLPWYAGREQGRMEAESDALCALVRREIFPARTAIVIDVHSGFGLVDRVWFPYARTRRPLPQLAEICALTELLDRTLPHHVYRVEPQARVYTIQGDLWDFLYDEHRHAHPDNMFIPLTLEMGSWLWLKKNPRQVLSLLGSFNPIKPHRLRRTLRRHIALFDVMRRAAAAGNAWAPRDGVERSRLETRAFERWYG